jgi:hypothetical protein
LNRAADDDDFGPEDDDDVDVQIGQPDDINDV